MIIRAGVILSLFLCSLTTFAQDFNVLDGYDFDTVTARMAENPLSPIEGVWQFMPDGATIAIERDETASTGLVCKYNIVVVNSVDINVDDGALIGTLYPTAKPDCFTANIYTDKQGDKSEKLKKFILTLTDNGHLAMTDKKGKIRLDFWRWLPYLFRISVSRIRSSENALEGCVRLFPVVPEAMIEPCHL